MHLYPAEYDLLVRLSLSYFMEKKTPKCNCLWYRIAKRESKLVNVIPDVHGDVKSDMNGTII